MLLTTGAPKLLSQTSSASYCSDPGPDVIRGRVLRATGEPLPNVPIWEVDGIREADPPCHVLTNSDGYFRITGRVLGAHYFLISQSYGCIGGGIVVTEETVREPYEVRVVPTRSPLDDTIILIRGSTYTPAKWEEWECHSRTRRWEGLAGRGDPVPAEWHFPSREELLATLLGHKSALERLGVVEAGGTVRIKVHDYPGRQLFRAGGQVFESITQDEWDRIPPRERSDSPFAIVLEAT